MSNLPVCRPPLLVGLSGPSGGGKDSIIDRLRSKVRDIQYCVSMTTRSPRPGEVDGKSYYFVTRAEYEERLGRGDLLAPAQVHGNWYGVPVEQVREALRAGQDVFLKIDVQGAIHLRRRIPQAVFIFLAPESTQELVERLSARHTESPEEFQRRLRDARLEMAELPSYDYVVVNRAGALDEAADGVACIIAAERMRTHRQPID